MFRASLGNTVASLVASAYIENDGGYNYVMLVGQKEVLIQRIKTDNSEIKFKKKTGGTIENFWTNRASGTYVWINEIN